ncbi:Site-specific DNA recombinase [Ruminococcaceae bacterium YRB3002]|nr:Site-specific DNA recombinase [Ruminococcaceae bacterium YRB3002]
MTENDKSRNTDLTKQKIRERYKGVSEDVLDVIPATPHEDFYKSEAHKRVAVYARVSTDDPNQTSSYELQKNHYEDFVNRRANWELVDIYADEGISGTSLQHRDNFLRMIEDCRAGKIDLIVTKSVSRFARNIIDCIGYVRQLKAENPPIGVFFETENIFTLDENSEMSLSFIATLAQEESHTKSEIMNSSIEMRFKRGIFLTPKLLGYDLDENGMLVINEEEAKTVRLIFFSYLYGYTSQQIANALTDLERLTKRGNDTWSSGSVLQILQNERYCGDVLARKTFTPNYLNHKPKKNNHERNQYRQKGHHEAIISREDFFAVQKLIRNARYRNKGYFPEMQVVKSGYLKGYVVVHPKWAGFSVQDYYLASSSVLDGVAQIPSQKQEVHAEKGAIDLRGYELVRSQFLSASGHITVSISPTKLLFNKTALMKIPDTKKIELLVYPEKKTIAVRKALPNSRFSLEWSRHTEKGISPKIISGSAFIPTLYSLFSWNQSVQYKITGTVHKFAEESILVFHADEATLSIDKLDCDQEEIEEIGFEVEKQTNKRRRRYTAYPKEWADSFGDKYYDTQSKEQSLTSENKPEELEYEHTTYSSDEGNVTSPNQAANAIKDILEDLGANDEQ